MTYVVRGDADDADRVSAADEGSCRRKKKMVPTVAIDKSAKIGRSAATSDGRAPRGGWIASTTTYMTTAASIAVQIVRATCSGGMRPPWRIPGRQSTLDTRRDPP